VKLKSTAIKSYRLEQLEKQNSCCALCGDVIIDDAVLDHDHKTGLLRQVLHRGCNSMLGKIENTMPRSRMNRDRLRTFALNLMQYIETTHTDITHPTHKEKKMSNPLPVRGMRTAKNKKRPKPPKKQGY
jgi:hypothetical protein